MPEPSMMFMPDWASPPGDTLDDLLDERAMTQTELAERLGVSLKHVNRVVKGAASMSAEFALGLEKVFGVPASFWMTREAHFQSDRARREQRAKFAGAVDWAKGFPIAELRKRGLLAPGPKGPELVEQLLGFLGIADPAQWSDPLVAYRKSQKFESDAFALSAWLREGELQAAKLRCEPYSEQRFVSALQQIRVLTRNEPSQWWPALQDLCANAGVAVVLVDTYKGARANGAARWLSPQTALIQLSLRHAWEDIFWFSFFHEACHVLKHRKKDQFVDIGSNSDPEIRRLEAEADTFAARTLIPAIHESRLRTLTVGTISEFAATLGIAPAIVVGRLHHENLLPHNQGNHLRRRFEFAAQ